MYPAGRGPSISLDKSGRDVSSKIEGPLLAGYPFSKSRVIYIEGIQGVINTFAFQIFFRHAKKNCPNCTALLFVHSYIYSNNLCTCYDIFAILNDLSRICFRFVLFFFAKSFILWEFFRLNLFFLRFFPI